MNQGELNRLCSQPGDEGLLWRLVRNWDPDGIAKWTATERLRPNSVLTPETAIAAVAEVMASGAWVLATRISGDRYSAIMAERGLLAKVRERTEAKLKTNPKSNLILPPGVGIG